jgi:hypothetical protein
MEGGEGWSGFGAVEGLEVVGRGGEGRVFVEEGEGAKGWMCVLLDLGGFSDWKARRGVMH